MSHPSTFSVCAISVAAVSPAEAAELIVSAARKRCRYEVHLCNAFTMSLVDQDRRLFDALSRADLNLPDGTPVAWMGRSHGCAGPVRGPGLVGDVFLRGQEHGLKHYLWGGAPGVARDMAARMEKFAPNSVCGTGTPPYRPLLDEDVQQVAESAQEAGADIFWVGLGTPRQDYLVPQLAALLEIPIVPIGAAFDFWSGRIPEAPAILQGSGLEWMYRLAREPKRLWRRYLLGSPRFLYHAYRADRRNGRA